MIVSRLVGLMLCILLLAPAALAQGVPERRAVGVQDMDFYGEDLRSIFGTTYEACEAACLEAGACKAFTFNTKASSCFLKSAVKDMKAYVGALSARVIDTPPATRDLAGRRAAELGFLGGGYLGEAQTQAANLGVRFAPNQRKAAELVAEAGRLSRGNDASGAAALRAAAVALNDDAGTWIDLAGDILSIAPQQGNDAALASEASSAAINGYLRSPGPRLQASALAVLARALEARGDGRLAIPALKLAQSLAPLKSTQAALDRAVGLFGFAIAEHRVDSDPADPRICVVFSEDLVDGTVDYAQYLRVEGIETLAVEAKGREICVEGVEHGARYRLTVRAGLPDAAGDTLQASSDIEVYVRDRAPLVRFTGRAYVLPKGAGAAIPIVTVNLDTVELKINRVGERNLLRAIQGDLFGEAVAPDSEERIADQIGEQVWTGTGVVKNTLNADVTTALPIGEAIQSFKPGVYAMSARVSGIQADYWERQATQWFVVTDLGLASVSGEDGLHVFVRSLASAEPVAGARLRLLSANNEVLGEVLTDARGYGVFAPGLTRGKGGQAAALVTAEQGDADFAFLDLARPGFDFGDRGVAGRVAAGPIDLFLSTERGIYRPGETVHLTALARDATARAIDGLPLTAIVTRPDGVEFTRALLPVAQAGGTAWSFATDAGAQRGTWRVAVHADPKAPALATSGFLVEDFLPERLAFDLSAPEGAVDLAAPLAVDLTARYLYGAVAAGLAIEGETSVSAGTSLPGYPGMVFGLQDEAVSTASEPLPAGLVTGADGAARVDLVIPAMDPVTRPLEMTAAVRVKDASGRPVERVLTRPVRPQAVMIGVKPTFDGAVAEGGLARYEVAAVGPDGARAALKGAAWTINRIDYDYQWYQVDGYWNYESVSKRERVASGTIDIGAEALAVIEAPVTWGEYELVVTRQGTSYAATSTRFSAGWYAAQAGTDTPDVLKVGLDKPAYAVGDTARLKIEARNPGKALVTVVDTRLIDMKMIDVAAGENTIDLAVTDAWGPGAYVTASLIRPMDVAAGRNPTRAVGLAWASVDPGARRLQPRFTGAAEQDPRGPLNASLVIDNLTPGDQAYVTIAAVDAGILNLTGFEPPAPEAWYFGQRRLGVEMRDLYGQLIDGLQGNRGALRSGGDGAALRPGAEPPTQDLVAFFSGVVPVGADGVAHATFALPDFNGTVRLMAVAWSGQAVGHASTDVLVRDPVVVTASVPRFMAPGDRSRVLVELSHAKGPTGAVQVALAGDTGLRIPTDQARQAVTLAAGQRQVLTIGVEALSVGAHTLAVDVTTPDGTLLHKEVKLPVRANDPEIARQSHLSLAPGGRLTIDQGSFAGLVQGSGRASVGVGPIARFDVPGLLSALDRYPYGCTEQTTSRALPLLVFNDVAKAMGLEQVATIRERVDGAITRVLANQGSEGGFGLWQPDSGDLWLDAYVTDFLSRARVQGFAVPEIAFRAALDNLRSQVGYSRDFERGGEDLAYALMVLAREGLAPVADLRYYADAKADDLATPLAQAQVGAALAFVGEQPRADAMFALASAGVLGAAAEAPIWRSDYGSAWRDAAGVLALGVGAGSQAIDRDALVTRVVGRHGGSTQDQAWALLAAHTLIKDPSVQAITVNGVPVTGPMIRLYEEGVVGPAPVVIGNAGKTPVDAVLTTFGVPVEPEPAGGNGYRIERAYYTLEGSSVDPVAVPQNSRLVTVLTVTEDAPRQARLMVSDPLPAGFEIDNPNLLRAGDVSALDWLTLVEEPAHQEFRADRFLAAVDRDGSEGGGFSLAYIVRAVSPGRFRHPAALVEDMYRPELRGIGATGSVEVLGATR